MAQSVICKDHDLQRSRSQIKNGTIGFLDLKNIDLDNKIVILSALVQKLWSKTSLCIMVVNVMRSCMSHIRIAKDIFSFIQRLRSKVSCVKL